MHSQTIRFIRYLLPILLLVASSHATEHVPDTFVTEHSDLKKGTPFSILDAQTEMKNFFERINAYRTQHGRGTLQIDYTLQAAAKWMSEDMATHDYHSHTDSLGRNPFKRMADFGYTAPTYKGENIAAGYTTAETVMTGWQNSPGHNANMLNTNYSVIGIGLAYNARSYYGWYWTTTFGGQQTTPHPLPTSSLSDRDHLRIVVYPNPASDRVYFRWAERNLKAATILVRNMLGEKVAIITNDHFNQVQLEWVLSSVSSGIYIYTIKWTDTNLISYKERGKLVISNKKE